MVTVRTHMGAALIIYLTVYYSYLSVISYALRNHPGNYFLCRLLVRMVMNDCLYTKKIWVQLGLLQKPLYKLEVTDAK